MAVFIDIWNSFRRMPTWVQIWVALILMPANLASLALLDAPHGRWIAILAIGGMALNMPIVFGERGFGKLMALPHLIMWTPLVILLVTVLMTSTASMTPFAIWLMGALLIIDVISLAFDYPDFGKWLKGDRAIA